MSIQLVITKLLVRLSGSKRITGLPKDKMLKQIRRRNKLNHFFLPKDGEFIYRDERVRVIDLDGATGNNRRSVSSEGFSEEFHCLAICHKNKACAGNMKMCVGTAIPPAGHCCCCLELT